MSYTNFDKDARMSSGMRIGEAIDKASRWWDETGRKLVNPDFNREREPDRVRSSDQAPNIIVPGDAQPVFGSGILEGVPWPYLSRAEQFQVVKVWHYNFVERADLPAEQRDPKGEDRHRRLGEDERPAPAQPAKDKH